MRHLLATIFAILMPIFAATAQETVLKGTVTDSFTGAPLPFASVVVGSGKTGTVTDTDGKFTLTTQSTDGYVTASFLGYEDKRALFLPGQTNNLNIRLTPTGVRLDEVTVKPRRERYSRRNNPAVELVRKLIERRDEGDPHNMSYFSYDRYEHIVLSKIDVKTRKQKSGKTGKFDFISELVDTLETGEPILPLSEKERVEAVYYRKSPKTERKVVRGYRSLGIENEIFTDNGTHQFLDEVFREVDIFQNNIPLFLQRFVSPLASFAPNYYKYYLLDTLTVDGYECIDLGFVPFNSETFGFTGHIYVRCDSTLFIQRVKLGVPKDINLNFVSSLTIEQSFKQLPSGTRILLTDEISVRLKLFENTKGFLAQRTNVYSNHTFNKPPVETAKVFDYGGETITLDDAAIQTEDFWIKHRPWGDAPPTGSSVAELMGRLDSVPVFRITKKVLTILVSGYVGLHDDPTKNLFEFGPMNSTINNNTLEGARFRVGGATTPSLSRHLFLEGYGAYGTKDGKFKYDVMAEYSFNPRKTYLREFPRHSLRVEYMYDVNKLGQQYMYTSKDNMMLMIRRKKDSQITYMRKAELAYLREHLNGISYSATLRNTREYSTWLTPFRRIGADGNVGLVDKYQLSEIELSFRYAHKEKFYQTHNNRIPITFDAFIFNISHRMAKKGWLGSSYDYQRTELGMQKRFWFSAFGYLDAIVKAGKVWNSVPFPLLPLPNANLTYTIQPETYTNMNALEFISDEYVSWDLTYYMNGNLLNRLPLIKKLQWREVFCFRGLLGHLSSRNDPSTLREGLYVLPDGSRTFGNTPYMEASVGIENIFKFLRIDYVWRLTYLNSPDIQKHGVRCTMALSF